MGEAGLGTLPETGQTREDQKVAFRTGLQWPLLAHVRRQATGGR